MFGIPDYLTSYQLQAQIEEWEFNSTLAPWNNCPNANGDLYYLGIDAMAKWESVYLPPAVKRLQPYIQGLKLTTDDMYSMQNLCVFETISLGFSEFCGLFTEEEWKDFEYSIGETVRARENDTSLIPQPVRPGVLVQRRARKPYDLVPGNRLY